METSQIRIESIDDKMLVGFRETMSLIQNSTADLWRRFMTRRNELKKTINADLLSLQIYTKDYFDNFDPTRNFEKWATAEVESFDSIPEGMDTLALNGGLYAVFPHKGPASDAKKTMQFTLGTWLPDSKYYLDDRPHFEVLGLKYCNNHPDSEEEFWIPIKLKPGNTP